jgi:DNA-binding SARP family transcriptional activator
MAHAAVNGVAGCTKQGASVASEAPVKVFTMGRFSLVLDEVAVPAGAKAQRKTLELLKVLIAFGGRGVSQARIGDALWQEAEADRARQNLKATIHRLRKIVGPQAIKVEDGKLTLDPRLCWVDAWTYERHINDVLEAPVAASAEELTASLDRALALYQGPFLAGEELSPFFAPRERLEGKSLRALRRVAQTLQANGRHEAAIVYLEKAIAIDPVAEHAYQALMRAHLALECRAEAVRTFERCYFQLRTKLGVAPSTATAALRPQCRRRAAAG